MTHHTERVQERTIRHRALVVGHRETCRASSQSVPPGGGHGQRRPRLVNGPPDSGKTILASGLVPVPGTAVCFPAATVTAGSIREPYADEYLP
jgi:hypothetical protein